jgi:UDP-N-acetylglucosamine:LPS N-acetylglucosamine transferase
VAVSLDAARAALSSINPHLVLFDCFPSQSFLSAVIEKEVPIALCIREMGNLNKYLQEIQDLLPRVSLILIPHEAGAFDLPEAIRAKSRYVGRIMRPAPTLNQRTRGDGTNPRVVVCGGGGGYPETFRFYNLAMKAISKLRETRRHVDARIVVGPLFREWSQLELISEVSVIPFDPNPFVTFASADLVISVAGYNTVTELHYLGMRTILLPAERLWDDQYSRAENAARAHPHFRIFRGSTPGELAEAADEFMSKGLPDTYTSLPEGASSAAYSLRSLVRGSSASA